MAAAAFGGHIGTPGLGGGSRHQAFNPAERRGGGAALAARPQGMGFGGGLDGELQVEQRSVGWLLGKGGVVLKEMEEQSGARISIDQSTKAMGYSTVRISGDPTAQD